MPRRTVAIFWAAVIVATLLLGGSVATVRRLLGGSPSVIDVTVLAASALGFAAAVLVAGRVVVAVGRFNREGVPRVEMGRKGAGSWQRPRNSNGEG